MFDKVTDEDCLSILGALKSDGLWASSPTKIGDGYWIDLPQDPIFVFKDNWHDIRCTTEGKHYEEQGQIDGVAKLYSYEQVHIDGVVDSTKTTRRGLHHADVKSIVLERMATPQFADVKKYYDDCMQRHSNISTMKFEELRRWIEVHEGEKMVKPVYDRDHHQFISRLELVTVFKDSINGHWGLVLKKFLHRDVSRGNVVISEADSPNKGLLIDQNYTIKDFDDHLATEGDARTRTPAFMAVEMLDGDPEFPDSDRADRDALDIKTAPLESPGKTEAQSTPSNQPSGSAIPHAPVHDLESFFLATMLDLCLQRRRKSSTTLRLTSRSLVFSSKISTTFPIRRTALENLMVFKSFEEVRKVKKITEVKDEVAMVKRAKRRVMHAYIVDEGLEEENEQKADGEKVEGSGHVDGTMLQPEEEHDIYELAPLGEPESPVVNKRRKHN
ncbi:hypothetical protein C8Q75DRAFT_731868 [Abortiporus biennis]|nr:hypothetical protein C8Q75DRAFT_731868 [Abortiporus biennis]